MIGDELNHCILNEDHKVVPCDMMTWARWLEGADHKRVVKQENIGEFYVSTVFLGLDHGFGGKPLWFETMIFPTDKTDSWTDRYATWDEAVAGHARAVEIAKTEKFNG